ncbi:Gfo/Idh/MocA family oxidoreductase, partial [Ruthenibacterium lactatiformans]|uniref:Gfo/Idh/MocA family oxidoreductase n=1 Tax=Ruthenibacterium lactatiformans TaxID=1550024 RepID=UPI00210A6B54
HYLHYPVSKYFAEHGVNVFCEKPVALNTAQAKEFAALETAHPEVHIGICLQNRLNESVEMLKSIIESGEYARACSHNTAWGAPRARCLLSPAPCRIH